MRTPHNAEFDYRWQIVKDGQFLREQALRETTKRWMALHLSVDGEGADWVTEPKGGHQEGKPHVRREVLVAARPSLPFPHNC